MSGLPLASVVIDNYNYGPFLGEAIDSALAQTYPNTEVVVVDDGSTDNSREVIARYGDRVRRVLKDNGGQASAFNAGFSVCRGQIIIFLDADDWLLPTAVEKALPHFRASGIVNVQWPLWVIDARGATTGRVLPAEMPPEGDFRETVIRYGPNIMEHAPTSGNAWRRGFLDAVFPVQEYGDKHGADGYLAVLAPIFGQIGRVLEPQACYRLHSDNYSGGRTVQHILQRDLRRYDHHCALLSAFLQREGITTATERWMGPNTRYAWMKDMLALPQELAALIPPGETFIFVDDGLVGTTVLPDRHVLPFLEREGHYWGPPSNDETAIKELERLRLSGAAFIVFVSSTFWWLEHYAAFHLHLRERYSCRVRNERLAVFQLKG